MERIPYSKTLEENSVEELFAKKFEELKRHQMDDETSKMMISLIFSKIPEDDKSANELQVVRIIDMRFKALGYTMDLKTKLFLSILSTTPAVAVEYCHYLAYFCKKNGLTELNFNDFCSRAFPFGFPSEADLHTLWDSQKISKDSGTQQGTDNLLDYFHASKSISNI